MTKSKKELKVVFAPGCFDNFEGTQEELDEMVADIHKMFANKTPGQLKAMSKEVEDIEELPNEVLEQIVRQLEGNNKRNLQ
jgi:phosphate uptake regulator